jgi:hypothetical protein
MHLATRAEQNRNWRNLRFCRFRIAATLCHTDPRSCTRRAHRNRQRERSHLRTGPSASALPAPRMLRTPSQTGSALAGVNAQFNWNVIHRDQPRAPSRSLLPRVRRAALFTGSLLRRTDFFSPTSYPPRCLTGWKEGTAKLPHPRVAAFVKTGGRFGWEGRETACYGSMTID